MAMSTEEVDNWVCSVLPGRHDVERQIIGVLDVGGSLIEADHET